MKTARKLYVLALECRGKAIHLTPKDPKFYNTAYSYRRTWQLLARSLQRRGWKPK